MMENTKLILIYYISTFGLENNEEIETFFHKLRDKIAAQSISEDSEIIFLPVIGESRIECINPKYITDSDLIKKHERAMSELHGHLNNQIEQIKTENNG